MSASVDEETKIVGIVESHLRSIHGESVSRDLLFPIVSSPSLDTSSILANELIYRWVLSPPSFSSAFSLQLPVLCMRNEKYYLRTHPDFPAVFDLDLSAVLQSSESQLLRALLEYYSPSYVPAESNVKNTIQFFIGFYPSLAAVENILVLSPFVHMFPLVAGSIGWSSAFNSRGEQYFRTSVLKTLCSGVRINIHCLWWHSSGAGFPFILEATYTPPPNLGTLKIPDNATCSKQIEEISTFFKLNRTKWFPHEQETFFQDSYAIDTIPVDVLGVLSQFPIAMSRKSVDLLLTTDHSLAPVWSDDDLFFLVTARSGFSDFDNTTCLQILTPYSLCPLGAIRAGVYFLAAKLSHREFCHQLLAAESDPKIKEEMKSLTPQSWFYQA